VKVTWRPDGEPEQVWQFDPDDIMESDAERIQKRFGGSYDTFASKVRDGDSRARRILLWHLQRQTHPELRLEDVPDYRRKQLQVEYDLDELTLIRDRLLQADMPDDERDLHLSQIEYELAARIGEVPERVEVEPGKASSACA
jgi:hypothetical protein